MSGMIASSTNGRVLSCMNPFLVLVLYLWVVASARRPTTKRKYHDEASGNPHRLCMAFPGTCAGTRLGIVRATGDPLQLRGSHDCGRTSCTIWVLVFRINTADWTVRGRNKPTATGTDHRAGPLVSRHIPASGGAAEASGEAGIGFGEHNRADDGHVLE